MLSLVRRLLRLRRELPALTLGDYRPLEAGNDQVIAYTCGRTKRAAYS